MRLTDAEWAVLDALWDAGEAALGDIAARLTEERGWNKNTAYTYLTRAGKALQRGGDARGLRPCGARRAARTGV